jgi:hypothetical protein
MQIGKVRKGNAEELSSKTIAPKQFVPEPAKKDHISRD